MLPELITGLVAIVVCVLNNIAQNNKTRSLLEYRLSELEKKVDKHNQVVERTYKLEQNVAVLTQKVDDME